TLTGGPDRAPVRAVLWGALAHVVLIALFAGPTAAGEGSLAFSSGSLRFAAAAGPFVVLAGVAGAGAAPASPAPRRPRAALLLAVASSVLLVVPAVQRRAPIRPLAASRLAALRDAFALTVSVSKPGDWIAVELAPHANQGAAVFLADLGAPGRRVGVLSAP